MKKFLKFAFVIFILLLGIYLLDAEMKREAFYKECSIVLSSSQGDIYTVEDIASFSDTFPEYLNSEFVYALGIQAAKYPDKMPFDEVISEIPEKFHNDFLRGFALIQQKSSSRNSHTK